MPIAILVIVIIIVISIRQINEYERGIFFSFGKFKKVLNPGWHIVLPIINSYNKVDIRTKTVDVPVVGINFPAGKVLRTFPSKVQVTFQVGLRHFKDVSSDDFFIGVTYEDVLRTQGDKLPLVVKGSPDFVSHVRVVPSSVDYLIEQQTVEED